MSPLFYLLRCSIMNTIKSAVKKPIVLIGYILAGFFIVLMIVMTFIMPSATLSRGTPAMFRTIMTMVFGVIVYFSLRMGIDKGSTYFRSSDVNLLFPAPFRPNQVLIYGFLKQLGGTLLFMMFALFQIPNIKNNFVMKSYGPAIILLTCMTYVLMYPVFAMLMYSWSSKSKERRLFGKRIIDGLAGLFVIVFLFRLYETKNIIVAATSLVDQNYVNYVPFIGWMKMIVSAAVDGINTEFWVGTGLVTFTVFAFTAILYRMNLDYYEDVLEATEFSESARAAKKSGRNMSFNLKVKKSVKQKLYGEGASAIFAKTMLEIRKTSLFLFFDRTTFIVCATAIIFRFAMPSDDLLGGNGAGMLFILAFSVYVLFFLAIQGRLGFELSKHYIFLIPATSSSKLFYATMTENIKNLIDGMVLFITAGILFKADILQVIICSLSYMMCGAVYLYGDVLSRRLLGNVHGKALQIFAKLFFVIIILLPGIIASVLAVILTESTTMAMAAFGGWAFVAAFGMFLLSMGVLDHIETP
jgi:hypothetical protein